MKKKEDIKKYWEERAEQNIDSVTSTTEDVYLRELEIATLIKTMEEINISFGNILDVGCGDGYSTVKLASVIPNAYFFGIDYSENMIKICNNRLKEQINLRNRVKFAIGDVMDLDQISDSLVYDLIISDRCLINLSSFENQCKAINQIAKHIKPGGYYIAIENFIETHDNMNKARSSVGLSDIPIRWHNLFFKEKEFIKFTENFFDNIIFKDFASSYYFATRIIYSKACQMRGERPNYKNEIHQLGVDLPWVGQFSPVRMVVLHRKIQ